MIERAKKGSLKGKTCTIYGCSDGAYAKTMCKRHYKQLARTGVAKPGTKGMHGTPQERFWNYAQRGEPGECWNWTGNKDKDGYGSLRSLTTQIRAHRLSYEMHNGAIPDGHVVRHSCHNPSCVNPGHLLTGTQQDNVNDTMQAGHIRVNEAHPNCKFSNEVVAEVRQSSGKRKDIAKAFGISESQVGNIRSGAQRPAA